MSPAITRLSSPAWPAALHAATAEAGLDGTLAGRYWRRAAQAVLDHLADDPEATADRAWSDDDLAMALRTATLERGLIHLLAQGRWADAVTAIDASWWVGCAGCPPTE